MRSVDRLQRVPWTVVVCALLLMLMGLSGINRADDLAVRSGFGNRQLIWILLSLPTMVLAAWVPYRQFKEISLPLFVLSLCLLVIVFFMPTINGVHRWIPLGVANLQPSEMAKLAYIMALAHYLMFRQNYRRLTGLLVPFLLTLLPVLLVLREPDLGTSLLFFPVLFAMLFAAGARLRHLGLVVCLGVAVSPVLWTQMSAEQKSRIVSLFTQADGGPVPTGDGYHLYQSKKVLALGGTWGSELMGTALSDPMAYHLPAGRTDFVFCLVGERWGLIGCVVTLSIYATLFARGLRIAAVTREPYGRLLAVGIVALLAVQTTINTGMTVGLMPITGVTLPLMSYGGSSLLTTCCALGLLINVGMRPGYEVTPEPFRFSRNS